jgi:3'-phosphoadenosine 5'-phosphosulfate (PAPS) 3'-phosphatase
MNEATMLTQILPAAKFAVACASRLAASVQAAVLASAGDKLSKADTSPVTIGDFGAQAIVSLLLQHRTQHLDGFRFRLLAEEESSTFVSGGDALQSHVLQAVNDTLAWAGNPVGPRAKLSVADVASLIDAGRVEDAEAGAVGRENGYFILDPIDGTKGFLRQGQWAVGLAYLQAGSPVLSVIACPNLPYYDAAIGAAAAGAGEGAPRVPALAPGQRGSLFTAVAGRGAFVEPLPDLLAAAAAADMPALPSGGGEQAAVPSDAAGWCAGAQRIRVSDVGAGPSTLYAESFERGHSDRSSTSVVAAAAGILREPLRCDSMVKYCMVARGQADLFMR